jgi:glutamate racemase
LKANNNAAIGVFDSGIGGLTVLREIFALLPFENTIYLGDTARVPYGIRSPETVTKYSFESAAFLASKGIKMLVIACNTASSISLERIKERFPLPVLGVIEPGAKAAVRATKNKRIGVIGTDATIRSGSYPKAIRALDGEAEVIAIPCPLFVPLVEEGWIEGDVARLTAEKYLLPLKHTGIDTLVLGCTHYPLLKGIIGKTMGPDVALIDSAEETAKEIKEKLIIEDLRMTEGGKGHYREFFVTDSRDRFMAVGERFLGERIEHINIADLSEEVAR